MQIGAGFSEFASGACRECQLFPLYIFLIFAYIKPVDGLAYVEIRSALALECASAPASEFHGAVGELHQAQTLFVSMVPMPGINVSVGVPTYSETVLLTMVYSTGIYITVGAQFTHSCRRGTAENKQSHSRAAYGKSF